MSEALIRKEYGHIVKDLAVKHKLPEHVIEKIVGSQFKFMAEIFGRRLNQSLWIRNLGTFRVKKVAWWIDLNNRLVDLKTLYPEATSNTLADVSKITLSPDCSYKEKKALRMHLEDTLKEKRLLLLDSKKKNYIRKKRK